MFPQNTKHRSDILFIHVARVVACIAVVAIHVVNVIPAKIDSSIPASWWLANIVTTLSIWAVPVFVMLSGAVLLPKHQETPSVFYWKRLRKVGVAACIWIPFSFIFYHFYRGDSLSLLSLLNKLLHSGFDHLYFLVLILELYAITPLLRNILKNSSKASSFLLAILFLYIGILWPRSSFIGTMFIPYIGYYLLGAFLIQDHKFEVKNGWLLIGLLLNVLGIILGNYYLTLKFGLKYQNDTYLYYYISPQLVTLSTIVFLLFKQLTVPNGICQIINLDQLKSFSSATLGIYILHPFILLLFVKMLQFSFHITEMPWFGVVLEIPFITICTYLFVKLLQKNKLLRQIV